MAITVNFRKSVLPVVQLRWDGRDIIDDGISDLM